MWNLNIIITRIKDSSILLSNKYLPVIESLATGLHVFMHNTLEVYIVITLNSNHFKNHFKNPLFYTRYILFYVKYTKTDLYQSWNKLE